MVSDVKSFSTIVARYVVSLVFLTWAACSFRRVVFSTLPLLKGWSCDHENPNFKSEPINPGLVFSYVKRRWSRSSIWLNTRWLSLSHFCVSLFHISSYFEPDFYRFESRRTKNEQIRAFESSLSSRSRSLSIAPSQAISRPSTSHKKERVKTRSLFIHTFQTLK